MVPSVGPVSRCYGTLLSLVVRNIPPSPARRFCQLQFSNGPLPTQHPAHQPVEDATTTRTSRGLAFWLPGATGEPAIYLQAQQDRTGDTAGSEQHL